MSQQAGEDALGCILAAIGQDTAALACSSAALLSAFTLLWAACGVEPDEIWMELHKRERLSALLRQMASGEARPARRATHPWRVDSSKLP